MAEYIERELLLRNIKHNIPHAYHAVASLMCCIPSDDVAPVVHARWIDEIEQNAVTSSGKAVHFFRCSACDFT